VSLRDIWPRESDFSDWLISEDGLELIADDRVKKLQPRVPVDEHDRSQ
jgi:hypothetical protein